MDIYNENKIDELLNRVEVLGLTRYENEGGSTIVKYRQANGDYEYVWYIPDEVKEITKFHTDVDYRANIKKITLVGGKGLKKIEQIFELMDFGEVDLSHITTKGNISINGLFSDCSIKSLKGVESLINNHVNKIVEGIAFQLDCESEMTLVIDMKKTKFKPNRLYDIGILSSCYLPNTTLHLKNFELTNPDFSIGTLSAFKAIIVESDAEPLLRYRDRYVHVDELIQGSYIPNLDFSKAKLFDPDVDTTQQFVTLENLIEKADMYKIGSKKTDIKSIKLNEVDYGYIEKYIKDWDSFLKTKFNGKYKVEKIEVAR